MTKAILVANTEWYLYNFRLGLARFLRDQGYEIVLVSPPGKFVSLLKAAGFRWLEWRLGRQTLAPWKEADSLLQILSIYRREKPDLVHHFTIKPVLYGSLAARLLHVTAIVNSITGLGYVFLGKDQKTRFLRSLIEPFYRFALSRTHSAAIFENDADRQTFVHRNLISPEQAWLVEGVGVDIDTFMPMPEPSGIPLVILPARMLRDKGVEVFVEAARRLRRDTESRFVLVGQPDPGNPTNIPEIEIQGWVKDGLVEWWGWQQDMRQIYAQSHIVTLPSLGEGIPTVLLEAAACARPIVATDVPGCRDVVRDGLNGYLVPPKDPDALAEALRHLISDAALRGRMGAAGRQLVVERFTSLLVNQTTFSIYQHILR